VARQQAWEYSAETKSLGVLVAPSRRTWSTEVAPVDVGLLLDEISAERPVIIDAGAFDGSIDGIAHEILVRAEQVLIVGCTNAIALPGLLQAIQVLEKHASRLVVVINEGRCPEDRDWRNLLRTEGVAAEVVRIPSASGIAGVLDVLQLGAEEQHEPRGRVEQHQDRHRNAGRRSRRSR
jgi:hypothetical protein